MAKFWDSFQVHNKNKHESHPDMYGGNQSNVNGGNTKYHYSREYYETKSKPVPGQIGSDKAVVVDPVRRRSSDASQGSMGDPLLGSKQSATNDTANLPQAQGHDTTRSGFGREQSYRTNDVLEELNPITRSEISKLSQHDFQQVYNALRKGEPNNNVNF